MYRRKKQLPNHPYGKKIPSCIPMARYGREKVNDFQPPRPRGILLKKRSLSRRWVYISTKLDVEKS